jgi:hypothetical protein
VLKRVALPVQSRTESVVEGFRTAGLWTLSEGGIYFVPVDAPKSVRYFDLASKQIRPVFGVDKEFGNGCRSLAMADGCSIHKFAM